MTELASCPPCHHENPPENRFCGSCGTRLTSGEQLATRQEHYPVPATRAWPTMLGPTGKALAVGVAALAAEASLSWLRRKLQAEAHSSMPTIRGANSTSGDCLVSQSLEEILVQTWGEKSGSRVFAQRFVQSIVATGQTDRTR